MIVYRLSGEFNRTYPTREAANDALGILLERQELHSLDIKEVEIDTPDGVALWRRLLSNLPNNPSTGASHSKLTRVSRYWR